MVLVRANISHISVWRKLESSVRQSCLKSPRSPQIILCPCFYFSPSCNKSTQMFGVFFVSVPVAACLISAQMLGSLRPSRGSVLCGLPPQACPCSSPLCSFPVQDLSWPWLLARAPLSVGASQHVLLQGRLLPHHPLCYPAIEAPQPVLPFGCFPSPSHLVTRFLGLCTPYLPPCPDHGNACNFSLPCKWEAPRNLSAELRH